MTPNDKLPEEIQGQINTEAENATNAYEKSHKNYLKQFLNRDAILDNYEEGYIAGATAWAQWKSKHDEVKVAAEKLRLALVMAVFALKQSYDVNDFPADGQTNQDSAIRIGEEALQQVKDGGKEAKPVPSISKCGMCHKEGVNQYLGNQFYLCDECFENYENSRDQP